MSKVFEIAILALFLVLAFWHKDMIFCIASGIVTFIISMLWVDSYAGVSVVLWFLAAYQIVWMGVIPALSMAGTSRGLSQFRGIINTIKGRFNRE